MADNAQVIWSYLKKQGLSDAGAAGVMGNLYAESGLVPTNLQNTYEKKLSMTDSEYTSLVDSGKYQNFIHDSAGYGLAQWTYWSRKEGLYKLAKARGKSIGDIEVQLEYLIQEFVSYGLLNTFKTVSDVREASNVMLLKFEKPASKDTKATQDKRAAYSQNYYDRFATKANTTPNSNKEVKPMANSALATYTLISPNKNSPRNHAIDRITIHCFVGQVTAKRGAEVFQPVKKQASCNYCIGKDGDISLVVDEKDRSWCTSSGANDHRAITFEVASDSYHPYAVTNAAYQSVINLCEDICRRYGKKKLIWFGDKTKSLNYSPAADEMVLTVHRWFANKACPGQYLYELQGNIATEVTKRLGGSTTSTGTAPVTPTQPAPSTPATKPTSYLVKVTASALNYRSGPGTNYKINGCIRDKSTYTIVEEKNGWGKLKSGAGWICLAYTKRI
jgi:hypothetical protein